MRTISSESKTSHIWVVIVTYNAERWIEKALDSVSESALHPKVIVVDNCSKDNTCNIIESKYQQIQLVRNESNEGFGGANNRGIRLALKNDPGGFVFLLNQDAYINPKSLEMLRDAAQKNTEYGLLSPIHLDYEGAKMESAFRAFYIERGLKRAGKTYSDLISSVPNRIDEVPFVNAAAWFIPCSVLAEVGGFDPIFFMYGEDDDLCERIKRRGWKVGVVPAATICHKGSTGSVKNKTYILYGILVGTLKRPDRSLLRNFLSVLIICGKWLQRELNGVPLLKRIYIVAKAFLLVLTTIRNVILSRVRCMREQGVFLND